MRKRSQIIPISSQNKQDSFSSSPSIDTDVGTQELNQTHASSMFHYFDKTDDKDAEFSHDGMILKQLLYLKQLNDYFLIVDAQCNTLNMKELTQFHLDQSFSLFMNIRFLSESKPNTFPNQTGIWLGRQSALLENNVAILFAQCVLPIVYDEYCIKILTISILLADTVFYMGVVNGEFNQFLSLLNISMHYTEIPQKDIFYISPLIELDQIVITQIQRYFKRIQMTSQFPSNPQQLEWSFFDFEKLRIQPVSIKKWLQYMIPLKILPYLVPEVINGVQKLKRFDSMFNESIGHFIHGVKDQYTQLHDSKFNSHLLYILPCDRDKLQDILERNRLFILEQYKRELFDVRSHYYYDEYLKRFKVEIEEKENQITSLNDSLFESSQDEQIDEIKNQIFYEGQFDSTDPDMTEKFEVNVMRQAIFNYFYLNQGFLEFIEQIKISDSMKNVNNFFKVDYPELLKEFVKRYESQKSQQVNKEVRLLQSIEQTLNQRVQIMEQKQQQIEEYCRTLQNEINNSVRLKQFLRNQYKEKGYLLSLFIQLVKRLNKSYQWQMNQLLKIVQYLLQEFNMKPQSKGVDDDPIVQLINIIIIKYKQKYNFTYYMQRSETAPGHPIQNPRHKSKDPKFQTFTRITQIQDDENMLAKRISMLKEKSAQLDSEIKAKQNQIDERRSDITMQKRADKSSGLKDLIRKNKRRQDKESDAGDKNKALQINEQTQSIAPLEGDVIQRQVKSYQAMIDNMLKQSNEYEAQKKKMRDGIESLRREKGLFQKIHKKLSQQVNEVYLQADELEEEEKAGLGRLQNEMQSLMVSKRSAVNEVKRFGKEFDRMYHFFESENEKERLVEMHSTKLNDNDQINPIKQSAYGNLDMNESPTFSKKKAKQQEALRKKNETNLNEKNLIDLKQDVEKYDNTFKQLMEETNTKHINEILQTFEENEEENYGLFKYLHGLSDELERLQFTRAALEREVNDLEALPMKMQEDPRVKKQNLMINEIKSIRERREVLAVKHKTFMKILQSLKVSIPIMFERIGCSQEEYIGLLGENFNFKEIDEDGIIRLLGIIERRTNDILQMQNDPQEGRNGFLKQNGTYDQKNKILEESNQSVNQGNQEDQFIQKLIIYEKSFKEPEQFDTKQLFSTRELKDIAEKECKRLNRKRK